MPHTFSPSGETDMHYFPLVTEARGLPVPASWRPRSWTPETTSRQGSRTRAFMSCTRAMLWVRSTSVSSHCITRMQHEVRSDFHVLRKVVSRPGFVTWWPLGPGEPLSPQLPPHTEEVTTSGSCCYPGPEMASCVGLHLGSWNPERKPTQTLSWRVSVLRKEGKKKTPTLQFVSLVGNMRDDSVGYKPLLLVFWLHQVIPECSLTQLMFQGL